MTTNSSAYETYPRPAPFVAPERWEQPVFTAPQPPAETPDQQSTASMTSGSGEREIEP